MLYLLVSDAAQSYHIDGRADAAAGISCRSPKVQHRPREPEDFSPRVSHSPSGPMYLSQFAELNSGAQEVLHRIYMSYSHERTINWLKEMICFRTYLVCLERRRSKLRHEGVLFHAKSKD